MDMKIDISKKSREEREIIFIEVCKNKYDNKYDYSKVNYINNIEKVVIICPIHGEFLKSPTHHKNRNQGCPTCSLIKKTLSAARTTK